MFFLSEKSYDHICVSKTFWDLRYWNICLTKFWNWIEYFRHEKLSKIERENREAERRGSQTPSGDEPLDSSPDAENSPTLSQKSNKENVNTLLVLVNWLNILRNFFRLSFGINSKSFPIIVKFFLIYKTKFVATTVKDLNTLKKSIPPKLVFH